MFIFQPKIASFEIYINKAQTLEALRQLPLRSIICADDSKLDSLRELAQNLSAKGLEIIKLAPDSKTDFIKALIEFSEEHEKAKP